MEDKILSMPDMFSEQGKLDEDFKKRILEEKLAFSIGSFLFGKVLIGRVLKPHFLPNPLTQLPDVSDIIDEVQVYRFNEITKEYCELGIFYHPRKTNSIMSMFNSTRETDIPEEVCNAIIVALVKKESDNGKRLQEVYESGFRRLQDKNT